MIIGGRHESRLADALAALASPAQAIRVNATDLHSLREFFSQAGAIDDLIVTVTGTSGAGPAHLLAEQDLAAAFVGKSIPHLRAVGLSLNTLAAHGSITLVGAGSAQSALPGRSRHQTVTDVRACFHSATIAHLRADTAVKALLLKVEGKFVEFDWLREDLQQVRSAKVGESMRLNVPDKPLSDGPKACRKVIEDWEEFWTQPKEARDEASATHDAIVRLLDELAPTEPVA